MQVSFGHLSILKKGHIERMCHKRQAETEGAGKRDLDTRVKDLGEDDTQFDDESYQSGWNAIYGIRAMKQWRSQSPMFVEVKDYQFKWN